MKNDHSEFIARHHKPAPSDSETVKDNPWRIWIALLVVILYIVFSVTVSILAAIPLEAVIAACVAFLGALGVSFFVQKTFHIRSAREKEREILHEVMEGSRGGRLITDGADNTIYCNEKFRFMCEGFGPPTLNTMGKFFQSDDKTIAHFRLLADQAQRGLTDSIELCSRADDRETWYMVTAQPVAGWAGYIHWRIDDITDRREIDRAIREEREKLIDFTDNAPVGFFSVNETGQFVFVNATLARWLGEDIESLLNGARLHTFFNEIPQDARPYDIVMNGGAKQMGEVSMKGPGGKTFMAAINQAVVNEGPGLVRTRGVVHDLTAERAMRQALKASEDRFQRFFEEAPLGIAMLNSEGGLNDCNQALAGILFYNIEDLEGRPFESLIHEEFRESVLSTLNRIETGGQTAPVEITLLGRDRNVSVQMFARKLLGSESIVLHFIDLTQQKELEAQFVQSQKMQAIGQLAGGVAHDFNNLLTAMIGFCDLLLLRHKPGDPSFSDIMQIKQNSNRAANLVRQLLAFSRQQTLRPKVQDITDILTEISHLVRRLIGANIELQVIHGQDLGLVKVDAGQMEQVLINLAVNARDAMEGHNGELTIRTFAFENKKPQACVSDEMPPGHWVALAVEDTGSGIPPEIMGRILEPFFTTKEVGQGTGLGLATVYGIVRQTGGYLDIDSKVGEGTIFTIYLPRANESEYKAEDLVTTAIGDEDSGRDLTGMARILLVEDEDAVRTFSARALANKGYEVLEAESGESALAVIEANKDFPIDLMITDVIMPNMDGPTLAKTMRTRRPDLKIIFISGYTEEKLKDHMGENIWFLPKPFTLKQLAAKVKEALEG